MRSVLIPSVLFPLLLLPALAWAQARPQHPPEALPPPDIDDPAIVEAAPAEAEAAAPAAELSPRDAERPSAASAPEVAIRKGANGDVVEEYRVNGVLFMVKVTPKRGPSYTLRDTNGDGRLDRRDSNAPVAPVYFTLYEWN